MPTFRPSRILEAIFGDANQFICYLILIMAAVVIGVVCEQRPSDREDAIGWYLPLLASLISLLFLVRVVFRWKHIRQLYDSEQGVLLIAVALSTSTFFGLTDWYIYKLNPDAFIIAKERVERQRERETNALHGDQADDDEELAHLRKAIKLLANAAEPMVESVWDNGSTSSSDGAMDGKVRLHVSEIKDTDPRTGVTTTYYAVGMWVDGRYMSLPNDDKLIEEAHANKVFTSDVLTVLRELIKSKSLDSTRIGERIHNLQGKSDANAEAEFATLGVFVYQSTANMIQGSVKDLTPASPLARTSALIFLLFKYLYFTWFVGLMVKTAIGPREIKPGNPSTPGSGVSL
jgi:hypothetical protein